MAAPLFKFPLFSIAATVPAKNGRRVMHKHRCLFLFGKLVGEKDGSNG
jgi:hypothetical protein